MTQAGDQEEVEVTALQIEDQVRQSLGHLHPNDYCFRAGCVMLACCMLGTNEAAIGKFLGISTKRNAVGKYLQTMREQHFFPDKKTFAATWLKDEVSEDIKAVALAMDMMVVGKELTRTPTDDGDFTYKSKGRTLNGRDDQKATDAGVGNPGHYAGAGPNDPVRVAGEHEDGGGDQVCDGPGRVRNPPAPESPPIAG